MTPDLPVIIIGAVLVALFGIVVGLFLMGVDRIVAARMQARIGPPLTQPFTDIRKLFAKENVVPENAIPWMFNLAPVIALASAIAILLYLPVGGFTPVLSEGGDLILVMYLLTVPALALVAGGFAWILASVKGRAIPAAASFHAIAIITSASGNSYAIIVTISR